MGFIIVNGRLKAREKGQRRKREKAVALRIRFFRGPVEEDSSRGRPTHSQQATLATGALRT